LLTLVSHLHDRQ